MIKTIASHRTAPNLLMLIFIAMGLFGLPNLRRETLQQLPIDEIRVTVVYPGASPEDVEEAICGRLEEAMEGIENIEEVRSEAMDSTAVVTAFLRENADAMLAQRDIQSAVDAIDDLPDLAERPVVERIGGTFPVAAIAVTADMSEGDLKTLCAGMKARLLSDPNISIVSLSGFSDRRLSVRVSSLALHQYGLTAQDVADTIRLQSVDQPAGTIHAEGSDVVVRVTEQRRTPSELESLVVVGGDPGTELALGSIATVSGEFEASEEKVYFNGVRAGLLEVSKTSDQDGLVVVEAMKRFIDRETASGPPGLTLTLTRDSTTIVADRLAMLTSNALQGFVLVFVTLWLFFGTRLAFWVAMSLPVSFMGAVFFMGIFGLSINMLTMVGLIIALGLIMDDGIVIAENVAVHLASGKPALQAAIDGTSEVGAGVFSSFATTVGVFGPLCLLSGDLGAILAVMPMVLILVMSVSLIEAFFILPGHLAHSLEHGGRSRPSGVRVWFNAQLDGFRERVVQPTVGAIVRHRYLAAGSAIGAMLVSLAMLLGGVLKFQVFPSVEGDVIEARILTPSGTPLERTEAIAERVAQAVEDVGSRLSLEQPSARALVEHVTIRYSQNRDAFETGPNVATVSVDLLGAETRRTRLAEILSSWRSEIGGVPDALSVTCSEPMIGPAGRAIEIELSHHDLRHLDMTAARIQSSLLHIAGVSDVFDDLRPGKPEVRLRLRDGAFSLGVTAAGVADQLRAGLLGSTAAEIRVADQDYEIVALLDDADRDSEADLESFRVLTPRGEYVPLDSIVEFDRTRAASRIVRRDGRRSATVYASVDTDVVTSGEVLAALRKDVLPELTSGPGAVGVRIRGEAESASETMHSVARGLLIGVIAIYVILSLQFSSYTDPLIVMAIIPLCSIGVVGGHLLMGLPLTLPSVIGLASLAGIVVNDSIMLVEFAKREHAAGRTLIEAACRASTLRFRAVLLTSVTTIVGLVPLLFESSPQAQMLIPLTTSIVFGLTVSTLLVLFMVPALYAISDDLRGTTRVRNKPHSGAESVAPPSA